MVAEKNYIYETESLSNKKGDHRSAERRKVFCSFSPEQDSQDGCENAVCRFDAEKGKDGSELESFIVGLTDLVFNPMIIVYEKKLHRSDGLTVTPAYWNQMPDQDTLPYWKVQR